MIGRSLILAWVAAGALAAQVKTGVGEVDACLVLERHGKLDESRSCFARLTRGASLYFRAEGLWHTANGNPAMLMQAKDAFEAVLTAEPKNALVRVRYGMMFLDRFNPAEASTLFAEALKIDKDNALALYAAALASSGNYEAAAVELSERALKADPNLVQARELLARLALEDNNSSKAVEEADKAIAQSNEAIDAMAVRASVDLLEDRDPAPWFARIFAVNPVYGEAHATAAHFFVINRRYEEAIEQYRKAIERNPRLWSARSELGVNLMRLGREKEAREQLEAAYNANHRDALTTNSLRLMDSYSHFVTVRQGNLIVKLDKKEAELLQPYIVSELQRAIDTYEKKYQLKLPGPVQLEVYPNHDDFAVRTMGLPGLGALGVTFGSVVAMDSPSGRSPGSFHWASTLWHEFSHVYVLNATRHRVPRWFTEGLAVHEETAVEPDWGDRLDPPAIQAIKDKKLLPVAELDRGFVRPTYPQQVIVSYFQAGKICDYIAERWGYAKLLEMIRSFAERKPTSQVIVERLGMKPEEFDKVFLSWLDKQTATQVKNYDDWHKRLRVVAQAARAKNYDQVIQEGTAIRDLYPDYVEAGSVYEFLADAYAAKGDQAHAREELARYSRVGGRSPAVLKRLAALQVEAGDKPAAMATLERISYIYLGDEEQHQRLGDLALEMKRPDEAIREFQAVLALKPLDQAGAHYRLARAYRETNRLDRAKEELLSALEAAPGFKPAQRMLLELSTK